MATKSGAPHPALDAEVSFRLLVESVKDYAIFMLDPDGRVLTWNRGAEAIKGYRAGEIIGKHFARFYPPEEVEARKPERALEAAPSVVCSAGTVAPSASRDTAPRKSSASTSPGSTSPKR